MMMMKTTTMVGFGFATVPTCPSFSHPGVATRTIGDGRQTPRALENVDSEEAQEYHMSQPSIPRQSALAEQQMYQQQQLMHQQHLRQQQRASLFVVCRLSFVVVVAVYLASTVNSSHTYI